MLESFTQHLKEVCMTYPEHMFFSLNLCALFFFGCVESIFHAIFPFVFKTSSTDRTIELHNNLARRRIHCENIIFYKNNEDDQF